MMTMEESYEKYYKTNHYSDRYPKPNRHVLTRVLSAAEATSGSILDIGAGNGRYAIPLAQYGRPVVAVERADQAREQLASTAAALGLTARISLFKDLVDVPDELVAESQLALLLFGVLGHMNFEERSQTLGRLQAIMPTGSTLLGSVPNRYRRFHQEQEHNPILDRGAAPRFNYTRQFDDATNGFEYTAFAPTELKCELAHHGWLCRKLSAESILSEETVVRNRLLGQLDHLASSVLPVASAYGIFFHARSLPAMAYSL